MSLSLTKRGEKNLVTAHLQNRVGIPSGVGKKRRKRLLAIPRQGNEMESTSKTATLDPLLHSLGFEIDELSPGRVSGRLKVTEICCQPFKVLHGGVSALLAEALASIGAYIASGFKRVAGVQLSINHLQSAKLGDHLFVEAQPIKIGKTTQVWEVKSWRSIPSASEKQVLISSSKVTFLSNMPVPEATKNVEDLFRKYAKL